MVSDVDESKILLGFDLAYFADIHIVFSIGMTMGSAWPDRLKTCLNAE
jgi:hypothetical protein